MNEIWLAIALMGLFLVVRMMARTRKWNSLLPYLVILALGTVGASTLPNILHHLIPYFAAPVALSGFLAQVIATFMTGLAGVVLYILISRALRLPRSEDYNPYEHFLKLKPPQFLAVLILYFPCVVMLEELVFRMAFIGIGLSDDSTPTEQACLVFLSSIVFGLAHFSKASPGHGIHAGIAGLVYGSAFTITESLWVPFLAHTIHNIVMLTLLYVRFRSIEGEESDEG